MNPKGPARRITANVTKLPEVFAIATRKNVMQVTDRLLGHFYLYYGQYWTLGRRLMKREGLS
jgi:hypothetical protein